MHLPVDPFREVPGALSRQRRPALVPAQQVKADIPRQKILDIPDDVGFAVKQAERPEVVFPVMMHHPAVDKAQRATGILSGMLTRLVSDFGNEAGPVREGRKVGRRGFDGVDAEPNELATTEAPLRAEIAGAIGIATGRRVFVICRLR